MMTVALGPLCFVSLFIAIDILVSVLSLGFYDMDKFSFDSQRIWRILFEEEYDFRVNPIDLVLMSILRSVLIISMLCARASCGQSSTIKWIKSSTIPVLSVFIVIWAFNTVKLLAFAEDVNVLKQFGVWCSLTWNVMASLLFVVLWRFGLWKVNCSTPTIVASSLTSDNSSATEPLIPASTVQTARDSFAHALRLLVYCKRQWFWYTTGFIFLFIYSAARVFIPYFTGQVIANVVTSHSSMDVLVHYVLIMAGLTLLSAIFAGLRSGCLDYAIVLVNRQIRSDLFRSLIHQEIGFFDAVKTGEMTSRLTSDCQTMSDTVALNVNIFLRNGMMLIGALTFMFVLSWRLTLVTFIAVPLVGLVSKLYGAFYERLSERTQTALATANQVADEVLGSMRTVRSFACEEREANRYDRHLDVSLRLNRSRCLASVGYMWTNEICNGAILVAVLFYGGHLVISDRMTATNLISFLLYQMQLGENLYMLGNVFTGLMQSVGASRKVFEYMSRQPLVVNQGRAIEPIKGQIRFDDVSFAYPTRPTSQVLHNLSFTVEPGETVALVGPSGQGKSSIVALIEHFYEPSSGRILLDGRPVGDFRHEYLHKQIALVAQEPVLYAGSIRENILYGYDGSEDEMLKASEKANVHEFVSVTEAGYGTEVGEKGVQLSGGQKQRVAIARALVRSPCILLLDEATSALDAESEHLVQAALNAAAGHRTVLVIAHRLSTVEAADRILVIDKGRIVEQGTHSQLVAQENGLYRQLVSRQLLRGGSSSSIAVIE